MAEWRASGLSARDFAREHGVNSASLRNWAWRLGRERRARDSSPALEVIEVVTRPAGEPLEIVTGGGLRIRVPAAFDEEALRRLLAVVSS